MNALAPTLAMLAAFALAGFGARAAWTGADRRRGVLMLVMVAVLVANVLVWVG